MFPFQPRSFVMADTQSVKPRHLGTFLYRYSGGNVYEVRCDSDTALSWRCLAGDDKDNHGDEIATRVAVRDGVHFISWVETGGLVVTQVVDFDARSVNCVLVTGGERIVLQGVLEKVN
jgi:phenolic acid decarboxylase